MHLVKVSEAASILGWHPYSVYAAIYEGRIKAVKFKGNVRINADEIEEIIMRRERLKDKLSVADVSRILSCSQSTVLRLIRRRRLKADRSGKCFVITPGILEAYVRALPEV